MELSPLKSPVIFCEVMLGVVPHAAQVNFLQDDHPIKVVIGGRRAGKSFALALEICFFLVRARILEQACKIMICARTAEQSRLVLDEVAKLLSGPGSVVGGLVTRAPKSPFPEIYLGEDVVLLSRTTAHHGKNLRGKGLSRVYLDEAGFVHESIVKEVLAPQLADEGGKMILSSTPGNTGGLLHKYFQRGEDKQDSMVSSHRWQSLLNPHINATYVCSQENELTRDQWRTEWLGEFGDATNALFKWEDIIACLEPDHGSEERPESGDILEDPRYIIGYDPAKIKDRAGLVVLACNVSPWRVVEIHDISRSDGKQVDYTEQVEIVVSTSRRYGNSKVVIDATNNVALVDFLRTRGVWVEPVMFTAKKKAELFMGLAIAIEKRKLIFPDDERLVDELRWFRMEQNPITGHVRYQASVGQYDDLITALALAWQGAGGIIASQSIAPLVPFLTTTIGLDNNPLLRRTALNSNEPTDGDELWRTLPMPFLRG